MCPLLVRLKSATVYLCVIISISEGGEEEGGGAAASGDPTDSKSPVNYIFPPIAGRKKKKAFPEPDYEGIQILACLAFRPMKDKGISYEV